jgi:hypothetical protein
MTLAGYDINKEKIDPEAAKFMNLMDREVIQILKFGQPTLREFERDGTKSQRRHRRL